MKHLSNLIETYLWSNDNFNKRRNALYLLDWISDMLDEGLQCQAMYDFHNNFDVAQASCSFERIITELDLLKKFGVAEINEDFLFAISLYEYHNGYYDSACEFLYYKKYIVDKLSFPYTLDYSDVSDKYYAENMKGIELEEFSRAFLEENNIFQN